MCKFRHILYIAVLLAGTASCSESDDDIQLGGGGSSSAGSGTVAKGYAARMEVPALKAGNLFIQHSTRISGSTDSVMTYCMEFDPDKLHSRWIAFRFDSRTREKNTSRTDAWADDPSLPSRCQVGTSTFDGYTRGHLCASADRLYSREANAQTFYMSNMSPQLYDFNVNYWTSYEDLIQNRGRDKSFSDTLYVVKGGSIEDGQTLGVVSRGSGKYITVPKYYFIALLKCKNGTYESIGFWMEHKAYGFNQYEVPKTEIANRAVTIDKLEQLTGIDFFPNLPDAAEKVVEASYSLSTWGLN